MSLINCETELYLSCSRNCIISEIQRTPAVAANSVAIPYKVTRLAPSKTEGTIQVNRMKFYVPVVTLLIYKNFKFEEKLK